MAIAPSGNFLRFQLLRYDIVGLRHSGSLRLT